MNRKQSTVLIMLGILGALLLIFFAWINNTSAKKYNWDETYDAAVSDQPYGTGVLKQLLAGYHPEGKFSVNQNQPLRKLLPGLKSPTDYVFVGPSLYLTGDDQAAFLEFIKAGNEAFIASNDFPGEVLRGIYKDMCPDYRSHGSPGAVSVELNFYHPDLASAKDYVYSYREGADSAWHRWGYLSFRSWCDPTGVVTPLGYQSPGGINFLRMPYGKGTIYIHTNPVVFTNFFLLEKDKLEYASRVFGHLTKKDLLLDEYSKVPFSIDHEDRYQSPLYYMLKQPSLKYAWWLLLFTVVLYGLVASRRMQRVIPVLEKKVNTSLEFVQLISTLHFLNGNHTDMASKKMRYFLYLVRSRYGIQTPDFTAEQMLVLAGKSRVSFAEIKNIFDEYARIQRHVDYSPQSDKLVRLFNAIENFKKKCK